MVKTKKRAAARAKVPTTKSVPDGMQLFTVHLPGHLLNPPSEHVIAGTDEEDAAERICTRWEMDVNVVKVVRGDGRSFEVRGERSDGEWNSTSSEEITPPPVAPPVTPPPLPPPKPIPDFQCSFCGKQQREVNKLIAGPRVYICNECLVLSNEMCLEDGFDVVTPARGNVADDGKRFEAAKKDMERATEAAKKADEIAAFLRTGAETAIPEANKKLVELARHLGADIFTKVETRDLLHLAEDARKANLSLPEYIGVLKARISLYERVTRRTAAESLGTWVAATMDIGAGVVYAMGAELAKAARAKT